MFTAQGLISVDDMERLLVIFFEKKSETCRSLVYASDVHTHTYIHIYIHIYIHLCARMRTVLHWADSRKSKSLTGQKKKLQQHRGVETFCFCEGPLFFCF